MPDTESATSMGEIRLCHVHRRYADFFVRQKNLLIILNFEEELEKEQMKTKRILGFIISRFKIEAYWNSLEAESPGKVTQRDRCFR